MGEFVVLLLILVGLAFLGGGLLVWGLTRRAFHRSQEALSVLERLTRGLRRLESVLDSTGSGILFYDAQLTILFVNHRLGEWFGIDPSAVVGRSLPEVLQDDIAAKLADPARLLARMARVRDYPDAVNDEEYEQVQPTHRFLRIYSGPVREGAQVIGRVVVVTDLTERRRREAEREALGRIAQALVHEATLDGTAAVIVDEASDLAGSRFAGLWVAQGNPPDLQLMAQRGLPAPAIDAIRVLPVAAVDGFGTNHRFEPLTRSGPAAPDVLRAWSVEQGITALYAQPLRIHDQVVGLLALGRVADTGWAENELPLLDAIADLAAAAIYGARIYAETLKRAQEAEEARASLQRFLAMVSHDLRGPVAVVQGYAQLLLNRGDLPPADLRAVRTMEEAARQMGRLIDDLLTASRIGSGRFEIRPAPADLTSIVTQTVAQVQQVAPDHHFVLDLPERLPGVWDAARVGQLLTNLVSNAAKYSPAGTTVRVTARPEGNDVVIGVADEGIGLTREEIAHLFQPFTRVNAGRTSAGTGLGLYIARGIVDAHHGRIWVESEPGKGSIFWVSLPREVESE